MAAILAFLLSVVIATTPTSKALSLPSATFFWPLSNGVCKNTEHPDMKVTCTNDVSGNCSKMAAGFVHTKNIVGALSSKGFTISFDANLPKSKNNFTILSFATVGGRQGFSISNIGGHLVIQGDAKMKGSQGFPIRVTFEADKEAPYGVQAHYDIVSDGEYINIYADKQLLGYKSMVFEHLEKFQSSGDLFFGTQMQHSGPTSQWPSGELCNVRITNSAMKQGLELQKPNSLVASFLPNGECKDASSFNRSCKCENIEKFENCARFNKNGVVFVNNDYQNLKLGKQFTIQWSMKVSEFSEAPILNWEDLQGRPGAHFGFAPDGRFKFSFYYRKADHSHPTAILGSIYRPVNLSKMNDYTLVFADGIIYLFEKQHQFVGSIDLRRKEIEEIFTTNTKLSIGQFKQQASLLCNIKIYNYNLLQGSKGPALPDTKCSATQCKYDDKCYPTGIFSCQLNQKAAECLCAIVDGVAAVTINTVGGFGAIHILNGFYKCEYKNDLFKIGQSTLDSDHCMRMKCTKRGFVEDGPIEDCVITGKRSDCAKNQCAFEMGSPSCIPSGVSSCKLANGDSAECTCRIEGGRHLVSFSSSASTPSTSITGKIGKVIKTMFGKRECTFDGKQYPIGKTIEHRCNTLRCTDDGFSEVVDRKCEYHFSPKCLPSGKSSCFYKGEKATCDCQLKNNLRYSVSISYGSAGQTTTCAANQCVFREGSPRCVPLGDSSCKLITGEAAKCTCKIAGELRTVTAITSTFTGTRIGTVITVSDERVCVLNHKHYKIGGTAIQHCNTWRCTENGFTELVERKCLFPVSQKCLAPGKSSCSYQGKNTTCDCQLNDNLEFTISVTISSGRSIILVGGRVVVVGGVKYCSRGGKNYSVGDTVTFPDCSTRKCSEANWFNEVVEQGCSHEGNCHRIGSKFSCGQSRCACHTGGVIISGADFGHIATIDGKIQCGHHNQYFEIGKITEDFVHCFHMKCTKEGFVKDGKIKECSLTGHCYWYGKRYRKGETIEDYKKCKVLICTGKSLQILKDIPSCDINTTCTANQCVFGKGSPKCVPVGTSSCKLSTGEAAKCTCSLVGGISSVSYVIDGITGIHGGSVITVSGKQMCVHSGQRYAISATVVHQCVTWKCTENGFTEVVERKCMFISSPKCLVPGKSSCSYQGKNATCDCQLNDNLEFTISVTISSGRSIILVGGRVVVVGGVKYCSRGGKNYSVGDTVTFPDCSTRKCSEANWFNEVVEQGCQQDSKCHNVGSKFDCGKYQCSCTSGGLVTIVNKFGSIIVVKGKTMCKYNEQTVNVDQLVQDYANCVNMKCTKFGFVEDGRIKECGGRGYCTTKAGQTVRLGQTVRDYHTCKVLKCSGVKSFELVAESDIPRCVVGSKLLVSIGPGTGGALLVKGENRETYCEHEGRLIEIGGILKADCIDWKCTEKGFISQSQQCKFNDKCFAVDTNFSCQYDGKASKCSCRRENGRLTVTVTYGNVLTGIGFGGFGSVIVTGGKTWCEYNGQEYAIDQIFKNTALCGRWKCTKQGFAAVQQECKYNSLCYDIGDFDCTYGGTSSKCNCAVVDKKMVVTVTTKVVIGIHGFGNLVIESWKIMCGIADRKFQLGEIYDDAKDCRKWKCTSKSFILSEQRCQFNNKCYDVNQEFACTHEGQQTQCKCALEGGLWKVFVQGKTITGVGFGGFGTIIFSGGKTYCGYQEQQFELEQLYSNEKLCGKWKCTENGLSAVERKCSINGKCQAAGYQTFDQPSCARISCAPNGLVTVTREKDCDNVEEGRKISIDWKRGCKDCDVHINGACATFDGKSSIKMSVEKPMNITNQLVIDLKIKPDASLKKKRFGIMEWRNEGGENGGQIFYSPKYLVFVFYYRDSDHVWRPKTIYQKDALIFGEEHHYRFMWSSESGVAMYRDSIRLTEKLWTTVKPVEALRTVAHFTIGHVKKVGYGYYRGNICGFESGNHIDIGVEKPCRHNNQTYNVGQEVEAEDKCQKLKCFAHGFRRIGERKCRYNNECYSLGKRFDCSQQGWSSKCACELIDGEAVVVVTIGGGGGVRSLMITDGGTNFMCFDTHKTERFSLGTIYENQRCQQMKCTQKGFEMVGQSCFYNGRCYQSGNHNVEETCAEISCSNDGKLTIVKQHCLDCDNTCVTAGTEKLNRQSCELLTCSATGGVLTLKSKYCHVHSHPDKCLRPGNDYFSCAVEDRTSDKCRCQIVNEMPTVVIN